MTTRVTAVYENGLRRPTTPLPLADGQTVQLTVEAQPGSLLPSEDEVIRRIDAAKTLDELFAVLNAAPEDNNDDLCEALTETRRRTVERLLFPPADAGTTS